MLGALLRTATFLEPDDLPLTVQQAAARLGAVAASISLVDYEQLELRRFSGSEGAPVVTKSAYGDTIDVKPAPTVDGGACRGAAGAPATADAHHPSPPRTGMLVPSYEVAGDLFDYAPNEETCTSPSLTRWDIPSAPR